MQSYTADQATIRAKKAAAEAKEKAAAALRQQIRFLEKDGMRPEAAEKKAVLEARTATLIKRGLTPEQAEAAAEEEFTLNERIRRQVRVGISLEDAEKKAVLTARVEKLMDRGLSPENAAAAAQEELAFFSGFNFVSKNNIHLDSVSDMYLDWQLSIRQLELQFQQQLDKMLDPTVYQEAIVEATVDEWGRYVKVDEEGIYQPIDSRGKEKAIFYYQGILNLLRDTQKFLGPASVVHQKTLSLYESNFFGKARSAASFSEEFTKLLEAYYRLYETARSLKLNATFSQLFSTEEIFKKCQQVANLIFPIQAIVQEATNNPVVTIFKNQELSLQRLLSIKPSAAPLTAPSKPAPTGMLVEWSDNLISLQQALQNILIEFVGKDISRDSLQSVVKTNATLYAMLQRIKTFLALPAPRSLTSIIRLVSDVYPLANELMAHFPQSYLTTSKAMQNYIAVTAHQLNTILRKFFLHLDELEFSGYFKEKYLFSLGDMKARDSDKCIIKIAKKFNKWVQGMNYEFGENERFPYTQAILTQRQKIRDYYLANPKLGGAYRPLRLRFLEQRVAASQQAVKDEQEMAARKKQEQAAEFSRFKGNKLELIRGDNVKPCSDDLSPSTLYVHLQDDALQCTVKNGEQLEQLALESYKIEVRYAGQRVEPVKYVTVGPLKHVTVEPVKDVKNQYLVDDVVVARRDELLPHKLYLYEEENALYCIVKKAGKIEKLALTSLKPEQVASIKFLLQTPSGRPSLTTEHNHAIYQLAAEQGYSSRGGLSEENAANLRRILQSKTDEMPPALEKAIFAQISEKGYSPCVSKKEEILARIDQRIAELQRERDAAWILLTKTKSRKQDVLQILKTLVPESVDAPGGFAPAVLQEKLKHRYRHLLFEGRTGKMLKAFRDLTVRRSDEAAFIEKQSAYLENKKQRGFWFFATYRCRKLTERITALKLLKQWLSIPGYRVEDALEVLRVKHSREFNCLVKNDQPVLAELRDIEKHLSTEEIGKRLIQPPKTISRSCIQAKIKLIDEYKARLIQQKQALVANHRYFSLLDARRIRKLENRITALKKLELWLQKPGYELDTALLAVECSHPTDYLFLKEERALLEGVRQLEKPPLSTLISAKIDLIKNYVAILKVQKEAQLTVGVASARKQSQFDNRILALEKLKAWLSKPGHPLDYALLAIESLDMPAHTLLKAELTLLKNIRELEVAAQAPREATAPRL